MTAVGAVVVNRVHSGSFPNTVYGVIYQRGQFGPVSSGRLASRLSSGVSSSARQAAQAALSGSDPTGGAKYFKLASGGHEGVVIGAIVFY
jgi:spore germination cell wall hydrolase CwlJ-like protein